MSDQDPEDKKNPVPGLVEYALVLVLVAIVVITFLVVVGPSLAVWLNPLLVYLNANVWIGWLAVLLMAAGVFGIATKK